MRTHNINNIINNNKHRHPGRALREPVVLASTMALGRCITQAKAVNVPEWLLIAGCTTALAKVMRLQQNHTGKPGCLPLLRPVR